MIRPQRIQLKRTRGWRLQATSQALNGLPAVRVTRGPGDAGRWGNPWSVTGARAAGYRGTDTELAAWAVDLFRQWMTLNPHLHPAGTPPPSLTALRGKNLACVCPPGAPCHANVLLELANEGAK